MNINLMNICTARKGMIVVNVLVFAAIAVTVIIALTNWGAQTIKTVRTLTQREQAFQIAEAGIEYYRWHLAHFPSDYTDATTTPQPYTHPFEDAQGNIIGQFALTITPPPVGSTLVTIKSKGSLATDPTIFRTVQVTLAKPSLARFAFVANDFMRFGSGTTVNGPIQSNGGIHFDGLALSTISSAVATMTDPDYGATRWGVYTLAGSDEACPPLSPSSVCSNPPSPLPNRPDVFQAGRQLSVPNISFSGITSDLSTLDGLASGQHNISSSGARGYHIVFNYSGGANGTTTYNLYRVDTLVSSPSNNCTDSKNQANDQTNWGTWSINSQTLLSSNRYLPANGVIFVHDNVWVDGTVGNKARITIAAGVLPDPYPVNPRPSIIINNDLKYTNKDGTEVIGLIAQGDVTTGLNSADTMEIDAALIAQKGRVGRFYYNGNCGANNDRNTLTLHGMIGTFVRYGFAYGDPAVSGYQTRNITYDPYLLYGPPPSFPLSSSQYVQLSWQEI